MSDDDDATGFRSRRLVAETERATVEMIDEANYALCCANNETNNYKFMLKLI